MESVKYEGVYPYKHNHSTKIFSWLQGEKFSELALLNLEMDERKGKQKRGKTNYLIKQQLKQITISMMFSRRTSW